MPFTLAHPAIVLPLKKLSPKYVSMAGLIIGSMLPDFEYFIRMNLKSEYSHTLLGLFLFCVPLGLLLFIVFNAIVKDVLISNFPRFLQQRFNRYANTNWLSYFTSNWFVVIISILIGACSHIVWDMFTHPTGQFVVWFPSLSSVISLGNGIQVPIFKLLQHGSTLFGFIFIAFFIFKMPKQEFISQNKVDFRFWLLWSVVALLIVVWRLASKPTQQIGNIIVIAISASIISLLFVCFFWKLKKERSRGGIG